MGMATPSNSPSTAVSIDFNFDDSTAPVMPVTFEEFIALPSKESGEKGDVTIRTISSGYAITGGDSPDDVIVCNMAEGKIHPIGNVHTKIEFIEKDNFIDAAKNIVPGDLIFVLDYFVDRTLYGRTHYTEYRFFHQEQ